MKALILSIFLLISFGILHKSYHDFDSKLSPIYTTKCQEWGGMGSVPQKFKFKCIKDGKNNIDLENDYRYTFYGVLGFLVVVVGLFFFSFQGNKNDD